MGATAEIRRADATTAGAATPRLAAVAGGANRRREPNVWRNAVRGAAVGFITVTIGVAVVAATVGGFDTASALGIGAFVGFWGGLGFGFMLGATVPLSRYLDTNPHRQGEAT